MSIPTKKLLTKMSVKTLLCSVIFATYALVDMDSSNQHRYSCDTTFTTILET